MQIVIQLDDAWQRESDGTERTFEDKPRTVFIASGGRPGNVFYKSAATALKLKPKEPVTEDMLVGKKVDFNVEYEDIEIDGEPREMTLYRVTGVEAIGGETVDEDDLLDRIVGKSAAEVYKLRSEYKGTPWAQVLGSKSNTLKFFEGRLEYTDGRYQLSS